MNVVVDRIFSLACGNRLVVITKYSIFFFVRLRRELADENTLSSAGMFTFYYFFIYCVSAAYFY